MWEVAAIEVELYSEDCYTNTIVIYKHSNYCCYKVEKEITINYTADDRITITHKFTNLDSGN